MMCAHRLCMHSVLTLGGRKMQIKSAIITGVACTLIAGCGTQQSIEEKAARIHEATLTMDTHIDWPSKQNRAPEFKPGTRYEPGSSGAGQWDLVRMKEGGLDGVFMSIFTRQADRDAAGHKAAKDHAINLINITKKMVEENPELAAMAYTAEDAYKLEKSGKRAIYMGMENGSPIGVDIENVKMFYDMGIRYITLTHSRNNEIGDSSTDPKQEFGGLSPFGEKVVKEMNRHGIMVDISHVHDETFRDAIKLTKAPVVASHSSAWALRDHNRNMKDDMLKAVKENGGVVQLCLLGSYIKEYEVPEELKKQIAALREKMGAADLSGEARQALRAEMRTLRSKAPRATLKDAVDHIDHMAKVMGIDHIGIGSDFDGGGGLVNIDDVIEMPNITVELLKRGYSEEDIRKIWGGNLMRVLSETEKVAQQIQSGEIKVD